ncbi:MAG: OmpA family protein [Bdellovibrionales bacterium]|nr:OmpA family protein [Bdellovibrionales bacterium]
MTNLEIPEDDHEDGENDEIWLISYSDMMTLLFGFFVIMYVFASAKAGDQEKVKEGLARSFGGSYIPPYQELAKELRSQGIDNPLMKHVDIESAKDGVEIIFRSEMLFPSGSAEIHPTALRNLKTIIEIISQNIDDAEIYISGHTDDVPIATKRFPSNWELSSARASTIVRKFIEMGYDPNMLVAQGYADTEPAYPNRDPSGNPIKKNQELNRRVIVKIVAPGLIKAPR